MLPPAAVLVEPAAAEFCTGLVLTVLVPVGPQAVVARASRAVPASRPSELERRRAVVVLRMAGPSVFR